VANAGPAGPGQSLTLSLSREPEGQRPGGQSLTRSPGPLAAEPAAAGGPEPGSEPPAPGRVSAAGCHAGEFPASEHGPRSR
jgi:hypothetical protein